jgi:PAS domain S-box-containing protein
MNHRMNDVLGNLSEGFLIIGRDHTIIYASDRMSELCGRPPDEIIGEKCHMVLHGSSSPCERGTLCSHHEVFTKGLPVILKHQHRMPDGSTRTIEISATPLRDEEGRVDRLLQVLRDITEEEKLRDELATSHQTLEAIFTSVPFSIAFIDKEMRVIRLNPALEAVVGMTTEMTRGEHCYDCFGQYAGDHGRRGREKICEVCRVPMALLDGRMHSHERSFGDRIFEVITNPVRDAGGAIIGAIELGHDITERRRAGLALQQSEQRFRVILDSTTDAIVITDAAARIVEVNRRATLLYGYNREELLLLGIGDLDSDFSLQRHREIIWETLGPGETILIERRHCRKDGSLIPVEIHIGRMEVNGQPAMLNLVRDVSERKRTEQALLDRENSYRALFESSPNVLCIADFSGIRRYFTEKEQGCGVDHEAFFRENPGELAACMSRLRLSKINQAALDLFGAPSPQELIQGLFTIIGSETIQQTAGWVSAIERGDTSAEQEIVLRHFLTRAPIYCILRWNVVPGCEDSYQQVMLSITDISARKNAENKLADHSAQLQQLSVRLVEMEEAERRRIAMELHDKIGQQLTAFGLSLNILEQSLPPVERQAQGKRIDDMLRLMEEMTEQVRDIMADLRPPMLDDYGLGAALRWYAAIFGKRSGIRCVVQGEDIPRIPSQIEMALFRVVQEALNNVAKHARASGVEIRSDLCGNRLILVVRDNGKGFSEADEADMPDTLKLGLICMRERVASLGGTLAMTSVAGAGTSITIEVGI